MPKKCEKRTIKSRACVPLRINDTFKLGNLVINGQCRQGGLKILTAYIIFIIEDIRIVQKQVVHDLFLRFQVSVKKGLPDLMVPCVKKKLLHPFTGNVSLD